MGKEQFNQLMIADVSGLTIEEQQFKDLHERICYNAQKSAEHWVQMAYDIKEMRETKRYKAAGFEDFGDYTADALGIKERQAYNYISVIEKLPEGFVRAHASIGVTKLALLTSVSDEEREEILESIDIDSAKTAEINAAVKAAIEERDKATEQLTIALEEKSELEKENEDIQAGYSMLAEEHKLTQKERLRLEEENAALREQLSEKGNVEPEVVFQPDPKQEKELKKVQKERDALQKEGERKDKELAKEREAKETIEKENASMAREKAMMEKEIESLRKRLDEAKTEKEQPAKVEIKDDGLVRFNVKFETLQDLLDELEGIVSEMEEPMQGNCRRAINAVLEVKF